MSIIIIILFPSSPPCLLPVFPPSFPSLFFTLSFFPTLSISSLYLFFESSFSTTHKKDTSWYITPPAANRCSATKSTTPNTSPGSYLLNSRTIFSSRTIPPPRKKPKQTNRTKHSGSSLNNRQLAIGYWLSAWNLGSCQYIKYGRYRIVHICFLLLSL